MGIGRSPAQVEPASARTGVRRCNFRDRLDRLVSSLLDMSRLHAGAVQLPSRLASAVADTPGGGAVLVGLPPATP